MSDVAAPTWLKRTAADQENGGRKQRSGGGRQLHSKGDQIEELVTALSEADLHVEREVRENSAAVKTTILFYKGSDGQFPPWAMEGAAEFDTWLKEVGDRPGENVGSPHAQVGPRRSCSCSTPPS